MDAEGQRLDGLIGPYDEGADLLLICEADGGKRPALRPGLAARLLELAQNSTGMASSARTSPRQTFMSTADKADGRFAAERGSLFSLQHKCIFIFDAAAI